MEFRVSHSTCTQTQPSKLPSWPSNTIYLSVLEPMSLQVKLIHTHIPWETLALVYCSEVTLRGNATSGKKGCLGQELFGKGVLDSLRYKEQTFTISNRHSTWSKS